MRLHSSIALAALAAALVVPASAEAKARHHARAAAAGAEPVEGNLSTAEQLQLAQQQLAMLQAQLNALQARIDAQATAGTPALAAAQAQAADASAKADKAIALATATQTAQGKTEKKVGAMAWAADTKISGRMYFNMSAINGKDALGNQVEKNGGFQIKRFYVGIDHKFSDVFAGNITVDVDNVIKTASLKTTSAGGNLTGATLSTSPAGQGLYIKKAYLEARLNKALDIRLGADDLPWIPYVEGIYGYRHIEKTIADLDGFGTSSDWGVHVRGELANGLIGYQVAAVDGKGYRDPTITQHLDLEGRINVQYKGINLAVGGYTGKLGNDTLGKTTTHTATRFDALAAYKGKAGDVGFTVGAEYLYARNWKRVIPTDATPLVNDTTEGVSLFASVSPMPKWSVFGRYDWIKPSKTLNPAQHNNYYNVGVQYEPVKIVDLALVYKHNAPAGGLVIGDLVATEVKRDEIGLYGQLRF